MKSDELRTQLDSKKVDQLKVIAKHLNVPYSGKIKENLISDLLDSDQKLNYSRLSAILQPSFRKPTYHSSDSDTYKLSITYDESWKWSERFVRFLSAFGVIWLLLEPMAAFTTGSGVLVSLGWGSYLVLVIISLTITGLWEQLNKKQRLGTYELVSFFLVFPKSGHRILIRTPLDMLIESFLRRLVTSSGINRLMSIECTGMHLYKHNLMIKTEKGYRPLDSNQTFREAHVVDGAICRLRGFIRVEYTLPLLDIEYSWEPTRLELARADGVVLLDEKDSIPYEDAKGKGLLSEAAIARVERFMQKHGGKFFVSFCPEDEIDEVPSLATPGELP